MTAARFEPPAPEARRLSAFSLTGAGLVLVSSVGYVWGLAGWLDVIPSSDVVRIGDAGALAVALGWAAFATTATRAGLRAIAAYVLPYALVPLIVGAVLLGGVVEEWLSGPDEFQTVNEVYVDSWIIVPSIGISWISNVLVVIAIVALGVISHAAAGPNAPGWFLGLGIIAVAGTGVNWFIEGAELAALVAVPSIAWLLWANRRASEQALAATEPTH